MTTFLRFLRAVWSLVFDAGADAAEWLRKPGSKIKLVCAVLALGCLIAGINSYTRGQRIVQLRNSIVVIETQCEQNIGRLQGDVDARDEKLSDIAAKLREEADKLRALERESAEALDALAGKLEAAERRAATWQGRYDDRPASCQAALQVLDTACPDLEGY